MIGYYNIYDDGNKAMSLIYNNRLLKTYRKMLTDISIKIKKP